MSTLVETSLNVNEIPSFKWSREERTTHVEFLRSDLKSKKSLRSYAKKSNIPRSTLRDWKKWGVGLDADPVVIQFFESSQGLAFLHKLVTGLHLTFVEVGACGIRLVSKLLKLTGLDCFIGSSYTAQRKFNLLVENAILKHNQEETSRLAPLMPRKDISVAKDETFSGGMTLVAIEPVSNFILLEKKSESRDAVAWADAMDGAMAGLNCNIIQSTSDEGAGLIAYCEHILGAHHSPDIFHVQQELSRSVSGPLAAKQRATDRAVEEAIVKIEKLEAKEAEYIQKIDIRGPGHPPHFENQMIEAEAILIDTLAEAVRIAQLREEAKLAIKDISKNYHITQIESGKCHSGTLVGQKLQASIDTMRKIATEERLNESCLDRIDKAERVLPKMIATIEFVSAYTTKEVAKLGLNLKETYAVQNNLIPSFYLDRIAEKKTKSEAASISALATQLREPLFAVDGTFSLMDSKIFIEIEKKSKQLANIFQRSSSCVEGRNGVISFRHHELHNISERKGKVLTSIHNFFVERSDKTTAAERFFESKPKDLFTSILDKVDVPCFPRKPPRKLQ